MDLSDITIDWLEERLEGWEGSEGQYAAWCPCHDDYGTTHKGLSISELGKKILCKCHSCGAQLPEVVEALEGGEYAREEDVEVTIRSHRNGNTPHAHDDIPVGAGEWWVDKTGVPWEVWQALGVEAEQKEIHFVFEGFNLYKYRVAGGKEFGWSDRGDNKPPLWPVPEDSLPSHIAITEGESDCGTARHLGYHAFAVTKGAGKGEKRYLRAPEFEALVKRGAREVTLFGDMDESGHEMMEMTSKAAITAGLAVNKVHLDLILDPFLGVNDLNGIWKEMGGEGERKLILKKLEEATQRVAAKFKTLTITDMLELADKEMVWLVPTLIAPSDKVLISGPQKSLKTYLALDLARSMTTCTPFMQRDEWTPSQPLRVHFVQEEGSPQLWARRIRRLKMPEDAPFTCWHRRGIRFTEPGTIDEVIAFCREEGVQVLFLDPMQRMTPGVDENDSSATGVVWDEIFRIQHAVPDLVVIVIHHANKTDRLTWESVRGSSRHAGEVDVGIMVQKMDGEFSPGHGAMKVAVDGRDITSDLSPGDAFEAKYFISDTEFALDATEVIQVKVNPIKKMALQNVDAVLNAVGDGCRTREAIISQTGLSEATVRSHLKTLIDDDRVVSEDPGKGKAHLYTIKEDTDESE